MGELRGSLDATRIGRNGSISVKRELSKLWIEDILQTSEGVRASLVIFCVCL